MGRIIKDEENPLTDRGTRWLGFTAVLGVASLFGVYKLVQSLFHPSIPGNTFQPPHLAQVTVIPKDRKSINLSLLPDPNNQLLQSVQLLIADPSATFSFTPDIGVITVEPIAAGLVVTAVGTGSAMITIVYPPDTLGVNDAIVGIGVF